MLERPYIELFQGYSSSSSLTISPKKGREEAAKYGPYHIVYTINAAAAKEGLYCKSSLRFENAHRQLIIINLELKHFRMEPRFGLFST